MPYHEKHRVTAVAKPSPSLLYDNLTYASGKLAYAHSRQAVVLDANTIISTAESHSRKVEAPDTDLVYTVKMVHHQGRAYLAMACENSLKVWDGNGTSLLYVWSFQGKGEDDGHSAGSFLRGISSNIAADGSAQLCVGSSVGSIFVFSIGADDRFKLATTLEYHRSSVTALSSSYQCRRGEWSDDLVCNMVSSDEQGRLAVWEAANSSMFNCKLTIALDAVPCTSLAVRSAFIICARLDGRVEVYGLNDGKKRADFTAHSRWISAMDIHPTKDVVVTASEDCSVAVWALPIAGHKVKVLFSTTWLHSMITGVAFCGANNDDVAAVAYDNDEVVLWNA